jgi:hypothetical protein
MIAQDYLQYECPTLYNLTATMNYFVTAAREELSASILGAMYEKAVAYLAAHKYSLTTQSTALGGTAGRITSKTEGRLSVSFGGLATSNSNNEYTLTNYGIQLQAILDKAGLRASSTSPDLQYLMDATYESIS